MRLAAIFTPPEARFELLGGLTEQNDSAAFLSGAFLACGAVTTPASGYRLEFLPPSEALHDALFQLLTTLGYPPKTTVRRGAGVLYYKESVVIEDILTLIGASNCALEMMEVKIFKDLRNRANRAGNCDSANIDKTVKAAAEQLENIRQVYKALGEQNLPAELREIAGLRLENPEVSLRELGEMLTEPLSRSGVNHRLRRIARLAQKSKGAR
jgi:DNA-binding protein WhiA